MNIYELAKRTRVPLKTLRKVDKVGALNVEKDFGPISELVFHMSTNQVFTVPMLMHMVDNPELIDDLGYVSATYQRRAQAQFAALGDLSACLAPSAVTAEIRQAAKGDDDAALVIAEWLMSVLPPDPVSHYWVAVRLLKPLNEFMRGQYMPSIKLALLNVRKLPEFAGYWRSEKIGTRNTIKYFRPANSPFDL